MKILLVDDHTLFRDGLALLIERTFPQFALLQAGSIAQALDQLSRCDDVAFVLLDLGLPDASGLSGLARLHENAPQARVIVLSADERAETIVGAIDQGASSLLYLLDEPLQQGDPKGGVAPFVDNLSGGRAAPDAG
jgi:DNA-binding NarL/FixJ family response regulator